MRQLRTPVLFAIAGLAAAALVACGAEGSTAEGTSQKPAASGKTSAGAELQRVIPSERIYTIDDLRAGGLKTIKEYDTRELPEAIAAWRGAFNQLEYEARFYPSHQAALAPGGEWADIVTGEDGVVTGDDVKWQEGARDRKKCSRNIPHSGCDYSARYGDFVTIGNLVLLCEGATQQDAILNCNKLLSGVK